MLPRKIVENFDTLVAILILYFWSNFHANFFNFVSLILSVSPNAMHFVPTFFIMRALGVRLIVIEKVCNYGIIGFIKNMFENGWRRGGMRYASLAPCH